MRIIFLALFEQRDDLWSRDHSCPENLEGSKAATKNPRADLPWRDAQQLPSLASGEQAPVFLGKLTEALPLPEDLGG